MKKKYIIAIDTNYNYTFESRIFFFNKEMYSELYDSFEIAEKAIEGMIKNDDITLNTYYAIIPIYTKN